MGQLTTEMGHRALVVTGRTPERVSSFLNILAKHKIETATFSVAEEPTIQMAQQGAWRAKAQKCDVVIGIGGGSVLDTGKAIAALLSNRGNPLDYLEVIGDGKPLTQPPVPYIAIPTTAGTGAEVTRNAVLNSPQHQVKVSLRSPLMLPRLAVIDPELTYSLPPFLTANTGLDALTQVLEPYVSCMANPLTDTLCQAGMARAARSLHQAYKYGGDAAAREDMALASLFGGLALANAKLGAVHGFAGPLGGMFPAPHGATCAALLPHVMTINVQALQEREPDSPLLGRYDEVAQILIGNPKATAAEGVSWVQDLVKTLNIPGLSRYGLTEADFPSLIEKAAVSSSMRGNPLKLTSDEMTEILKRAL